MSGKEESGRIANQVVGRVGLGWTLISDEHVEGLQDITSHILISRLQYAHEIGLSTPISPKEDEFPTELDRP